MKRLWCLVGILTCFTLSCSSGGSGSGGGGNIVGSSTIYKKEDLAGSWSYSARQQGGPEQLQRDDDLRPGSPSDRNQ